MAQPDISSILAALGKHGHLELMLPSITDL